MPRKRYDNHEREGLTKSRPRLAPKHTIKGRKYKYPTTVEGKKKLFEKARRYFAQLRKNPNMPKDKLHNKYLYAYYGSRPKQRQRRKTHMRHRRILEDAGFIKKYDGTEIDHMNRKKLTFESIIIRKNRCAHNEAHGLHCHMPFYRPRRKVK